MPVRRHSQSSVCERKSWTSEYCRFCIVSYLEALIFYLEFFSYEIRTLKTVPSENCTKEKKTGPCSVRQCACGCAHEAELLFFSPKDHGHRGVRDFSCFRTESKVFLDSQLSSVEVRDGGRAGEARPAHPQSLQVKVETVCCSAASVSPQTEPEGKSFQK